MIGVVLALARSTKYVCVLINKLSLEPLMCLDPGKILYVWKKLKKSETTVTASVLIVL